MFKFFLTAIVMSWSTLAFAYIPPSEYILKAWVNQHSGAKSLRIRSLVTAMEKDKPTEVHFKDITWVNPESLIVKSVAMDDQDKKLYRSERHGKSLSTLAKFLLSSDLRTVTQVLRDKGVPIRTEAELIRLRTEAERRQAENESLMRWNGGLAWVIGTQLWMQKDTFLPLRLIYTSNEDSQEYDARFEGLRTFGHFAYPKVSNLTQKGNWILSSDIIDISADNESVAARFGHSAGSDSGYTEAGNSASSSLRDLIRLYYDSFR